jgi:RNA polymerase sigma factor (sigma-70 family)
MLGVPETKLSLILRLRDHRDAVAWSEFVAVYEPVIHRLGRRHGLQEADARELVQEVLLAVARAVSRWEPNGRARFRAWLFRIVRNELLDHLSRRRRLTRGSGSSSVNARLHQLADPCGGLAEEIERQYRHEVFGWAAARVRQQVHVRTWDAFWRTSVQDVPAGEVARDLGLSVGAVYIARSRVLARLRAEVQAFEDEHAL